MFWAPVAAPKPAFLGCSLVWFRLPSALYRAFGRAIAVGLLKVAVVLRPMITTVFSALCAVLDFNSHHGLPRQWCPPTTKRFTAESFVAQCGHRVDSQGAASGNVAREQGHEGEDKGDHGA